MTDDFGELAQVCWCDTNVRHVPPAVIKAGEGWSCCPACQPGCAPGVGPRGAETWPNSSPADTADGILPSAERTPGMGVTIDAVRLPAARVDMHTPLTSLRADNDAVPGDACTHPLTHLQ